MGKRTVADGTVEVGETEPIADGVETERNGSIESAAKKYAEKRDLHAKLGGEKKNALLKLGEVMQANRDALIADDEGRHWYRRGGFKIVWSEKDSYDVTVPGDESPAK